MSHNKRIIDLKKFANTNFSVNGGMRSRILIVFTTGSSRRICFCSIAKFNLKFIKKFAWRVRGWYRGSRSDVGSLALNLIKSIRITAGVPGSSLLGWRPKATRLLFNVGIQLEMPSGPLAKHH